MGKKIPPTESLSHRIVALKNFLWLFHFHGQFFFYDLSVRQKADHPATWRTVLRPIISRISFLGDNISVGEKNSPHRIPVPQNCRFEKFSMVVPFPWSIFLRPFSPPKGGPSRQLADGSETINFFLVLASSG